MTYRILIVTRASRELGDLPADVRDKVSREVRALSDEPRPSDSRKLRSREGWRIRVGAYRVIYEIDDTERAITVLHIGHRRDVYR